MQEFFSSISARYHPRSSNNRTFEPNSKDMVVYDLLTTVQFSDFYINIKLQYFPFYCLQILKKEIESCFINFLKIILLLLLLFVCLLFVKLCWKNCLKNVGHSPNFAR